MNVKIKNQKGISSLWGIVIVAILAIIIGLGTYVACTYYFTIDTKHIPIIKTQNEFLKVISLRPNQIIENPVQISGKSSFSEGNMRIRIKDNDNNILVDTFTTAQGEECEMGELCQFFKEIVFQKPTTKKGFVEIFEESAKDGSEINKITIPVIFENLDYPKIENVYNLQDDFKYHEGVGYYGNLVVRGYATTSLIPEAFCKENCPIYTYVLFNIVETNNEFIDDFIAGFEGNSFLEDGKIGLGCIENDALWHINDSDEFRMKKYTISLETSKAILNSNCDNLVTIKLERYPYTSGTDAPDCYSHFGNIVLLK
jgi:hypothetical protein